MDGPKILLVEDDTLIRTMLAEALEDAGCRVVEAGSGDEAAALLAQGIDGFDALVTDIQLPGERDGLAVAREARALHPALPVVYATGRPEVMNAMTGGLGPRDAFLPKPFGPREMLGALGGLLKVGLR